MTVAAQFLELFDQSMTRVLGEARFKGFEDQIDINDWNWRIENKEIKDQSGQGRGQGARIEPSIFSFSKGPDRATVRLVQAMHNGEVFRKAQFTLMEELAGDQAATGGEFHLVIELTEVIVLRYDLQVRAGDTEVELDETWDFSYRDITFLYDQGAHQTKMTRPPGTSDERSGSTVDEMVKKAKNELDDPQRKELIQKLGSLDKGG